MIRSLSALSGLTACLMTGCHTDSAESLRKQIPLTADSIPTFYPTHGTEINFVVTAVEEKSGTSTEQKYREVWQWKRVGSDLQLTKTSEAKKPLIETYNISSSICLESVDGIEVSPCMPVLVDRVQENPVEGFTGPATDGVKGRFSAEHRYLGPETLIIKERQVPCHKIIGKRTFNSGGIEVLIESESWWAEGLGIVKRVETVTSKGLKRVTTLTQSPK